MRALGLILLVGCADNFAPVFEPPIPDRVAVVGETITFPVRAIDRDGDSLQYGARGLPVGSTFDRSRSPAVFRWSPVASDAEGAGRVHPVTFIAQDSNGATAEARVLLTVYLGDSAPRFTSPASYVLDVGFQRELAVWITVRDDDSREVNFDLVEAPEGAQLEPDVKRALLRWSPSPDQLARRRVFGFIINAWDDDPARFTQQQVSVVVQGEL